MAAKVHNFGGDYQNHDRLAATNRNKDVDNRPTPGARTERTETQGDDSDHQTKAEAGTSTQEEEVQEKKTSKRKKRTAVEG